MHASKKILQKLVVRDSAPGLNLHYRVSVPMDGIDLKSFIN